MNSLELSAVAGPARRRRLLTDQAAQALPAYPAVAAVPGPVNKERFAAHLAHRDITPEPAVVTSVAVVTHDEDMPFGNDLRTIIIAVYRAAQLRIVAFEVSVRIVDRFAVDKDLFIADLDGIP